MSAALIWATVAVAVAIVAVVAMCLLWWRTRAAGRREAELRAALDQVEATRVELAFSASHDALTGLNNRSWFESRLRHVWSTLPVSGAQCVLCYLDLDQFKVVNDTCGHLAGDELLRDFATRLRERIRQSDTVARLGGDEFGILFEGCSTEAATVLLEEFVRETHDRGFRWHDRVFEVGLSAGLVALVPGVSPVESLARADVACYAAKEAGRNRVHVYEAGDTWVRRRLDEMERVSRIGHILRESQLRLFAQRIIPMGDGTEGPVHYEVLVRVDEGDGAAPALPGKLLQAAESFGLMPLIDQWVVEHVLEAIRPLAGLSGAPVFSINLSGQSLGRREFLARMIELLSATPFPLDRLCLEVTESAVVADMMRGVRFVSVLKGMGVKIAIDDFGKGMSSFGYLKEFAADYLKVDGAFVIGIGDDPANRAIVEGINSVGHALGLGTVAECVEDEVCLAALHEIGVDYAQGFAIHRPEPLERIVAACVETKPVAGPERARVQRMN